MKNSILIILFSFNSLVVFAQRKNDTPYDPNKTFTPTQLKEDFSYLRKCLTEAHQSLYRYTSKDSLDKTFDIFEKSLTTDLTEKAFRNQLSPVVNEIKCGHSTLQSSKARQKFLNTQKTKYLPFNIMAISNRLFIKENKSTDTSLLAGTEILSIEGQKSEDLIKQLNEIIVRDGYNQTFPEYFLRNRFSQFYARLFEEKDTFTLVVKTKDAPTRNIKTPCIDKLLTTPFPTIAKENKAIYTHSKTSYLTLDAQNSNIAILKIKGFSMLGYWRFYRKTFKYIKKNNIEHLVLDLRDNGGGFVFNSGRLMGYLLDKPQHINISNKGVKPAFVAANKSNNKNYNKTFRLFRKVPKKWGIETLKNDSFYQITYTNKVDKDNYKGKLYVLTNGLTFSASGIVSAYLKKEKRATFIGEETGGCEEGSNGFNTPTVTLPNSKLQYIIPIFRIDHDGATPLQKGRGIIPDFPINYDVQDRLLNKDLEMEKVRIIVSEK